LAEFSLAVHDVRRGRAVPLGEMLVQQLQPYVLARVALRSGMTERCARACQFLFDAFVQASKKL
jgi:hypothetical protein